MLKVLKSAALKGINGALGVVGCKLVRASGHDWGDAQQFIPFRDTLAGAKEARQSVGEYIDAKHNFPGATQETHDRLISLGVFKDRSDRVCEIGPGSGRFLEKTLQTCKPSQCEIYETAGEWRDWLAETFPVTVRPTDGTTLSATPSNSIDLVQAHKVFVCLSFSNTCSYFTEIVRVTKPGAWAVFDVMTENCMDNTNIPLWLEKDVKRTYPSIMPKTFVINFFETHGFRFVASFLEPMKPGRTECMVFHKESA